ncbi:hypothetical protein Mapa_005762 [Marchantia paleacea]|nr:hypothetical protein Mapa_005762 [Marchantia paleacea]
MGRNYYWCFSCDILMVEDCARMKESLKSQTGKFQVSILETNPRQIVQPRVAAYLSFRRGVLIDVHYFRLELFLLVLNVLSKSFL